MRLSVIFMLLFSIPVALSQISPECALEIKENCKEQIKKVDYLASQVDKEFPPLSTFIEKYDRVLQKALNCSSSVPCARDQPLLAISDAFRKHEVAEKDYPFDLDCIYEVLGVIGTFSCAKNFDFLAKNPIKKRKVFLSGKSCVLKMAHSTCSAEHYAFLVKNYDDLMSTYTLEPKQNNGLCNSAYDKFGFIQCYKLAKHSIMDGPFGIVDFQMDDYNSRCRELQSCAEDSCIYTVNFAKRGYPDYLKNDCDHREAFFNDLKRLFHEVPTLRELKCLKLQTVALQHQTCPKEMSEESCWIRMIREDKTCQKEIWTMLMEKKLMLVDV